jgi:hypothetical protein
VTAVSLAADLDLAEKLIKQLHIEWDKFFGGVEKKPPNELKLRVDALFRRMAGAETRNNAERFRLQTVQTTYSTFTELWGKRLRALEEGQVFGLHGRAARQHTVAMPPPPSLPVTADRKPPPRPSPGGEVRIRDAGAETTAVAALFNQFVEARQKLGQGGAVAFEQFHKLISQQASRILAEKGAQAVDFRLETKDGKVSLKAKPVR